MARVAGFVQADFGPAYEVDVDPEFPGNGVWPVPVYVFDGDGRVQSDLLASWGAPPCVVRVRPVGASEWVGVFPGGGVGGVTVAHATPAPRLLCVIVDGEAFVVHVDRPAAGAVAVFDMVQQVVPGADPPVLLLVAWTAIVALGPDGALWRSPRLALDELRVVGVDRDGIRCLGLGDALTGEPESIVVDPATGHVVSGHPLAGPSWDWEAPLPRRGRQRASKGERAGSRLWSRHPIARLPSLLRRRGARGRGQGQGDA